MTCRAIPVFNLLTLADKPGNVSTACRPRPWTARRNYRWKAKVERWGAEALNVHKCRRSSSVRRRAILAAPATAFVTRQQRRADYWYPCDRALPRVGRSEARALLLSSGGANGPLEQSGRVDGGVAAGAPVAGA